ncbi:MAG TPA: PEP-CTERM sorting domain-containing protein, partial [Phycisphaerae bacterium]|nr:PEP-CTERM sorting domain-containing protein [Phycisphaerae bacterium]
TVTIGTGQNGTLIQLQPGDLTFAYTLDYTGGKIGPPESPVKDFQLYRVIIDEVISATPINNPGPFMALGNVLGGAYNTASGFNPKPFVAFPNGFTGEEIDFPLPEEGGPFQTSEAQFSWPSNQQIMPGDKVMALMFCRDVTWMEIGSASGGTGEGGNVLGAGVELKNFPVLIPVLTPEPATGLLIVLGTGILCRRRRC